MIGQSLRYPLAVLARITLAMALLVPAAFAQEVQRGEPVTVTATRLEANPFDVPASIDRIDGSTVRDGRLQVNLSESTGAVPGLSLANRQNYAQDLQLSIRGFGARSTFGIRGVRLYVDGIPATQPDGQGQLSNIDLASVDRIEVLRGPFSALYGNSSGGVVQVFTEDADPGLRITPSFAAGSDHTLRVGLKASATVGAVGAVVSTSHFETDGPRPHSAARRDLGNAKLVFTNDGTRVTLVVNSVDLPFAQDPLGLTRAQFTNDPRSVDAAATTFDTRKSFAQTQGGLVIEQRLTDDDRARVLVYGGRRTTQQYQSIPVASQIPVTSAGGVIDLDRRYVGTDLRFTHRARVGAQTLDLVAGVAFDRLDERRRGFENFSGPANARVLGVQGVLRRDEDNDVTNADEYLQLSWKPTERWSVDAGLRHSAVRFGSRDHFIVGANPDDSGSVRDHATLPVAGVLFAATPAIHLYGTAGRGFETPTFNELSYRPDGATGLNFALAPAKSTSLEAGVKTRFDVTKDAPLLANVALFTTRVDDELVTLSNVGGRSTYTNAGATRRRGVEASLAWDFARDWRLLVAYSLLDARYRQGFFSCAATPCAVPNVAIPAGNRLPGTAANNAYVEVAYAPRRGWRFGIEARRTSKVWVDDANTDSASSYAIVNGRVAYRWVDAATTIDLFARVDNAFDRTYAGSVIVNEGNGRFFEPAPGRKGLVGASASFALGR